MTLPKSCIPVPKIEEDCYDWYERHASRCALAEKNQYDLVFIGDSITHFWEGDDGADYGSSVWKKFYGRRKVLNLGFGCDRTQNVLWRLQHDELKNQHPKVIVLNIGTNQFSTTKNWQCDTAEGAAAGIVCVTETLRAMFPETELIVMAVFPRGLPGQPVGELIRQTNGLVREKLAGQSKITFLDIGDQLSNPDGSLKMDLYRQCLTHLNENGYQVWAEALEPMLKKMLGE